MDDTNNATVTLSYNGSRNTTDGTPKQDFIVKLHKEDDAPALEVGAEVILLFLPSVNGINEKYNEGKDTKYFVRVDISGFQTGDNRSFSLKCHRGFGWRKFWDREQDGEHCGVDRDGNIAGENFWNAVSYNTGVPTDVSDYGNLTLEDAKTKWTDVVGLIDLATHGTTNSLRWYWRRRFPAGPPPGQPPTAQANPDKFELYGPPPHDPDPPAIPAPNPPGPPPPTPPPPPHTAGIKASDISSLDLNDVLLAILVSCDSATADDAGESLAQAFADAGVDVVLSWNEVTYESEHQLFVKYFLEYAYQKTQTLLSADNWEGKPRTVEWTNYPIVNDAILRAYFKLVDEIDDDKAKFVGENHEVGGANPVPGIIKLYPARYGAKD